MRRLAPVLASLVLLGLMPGAEGATESWLDRRVLHFAHQGGEIEAPSDTLFALKTAKRKGADVVEIDVHATSDGQIVALHDTTVDRTTEGTGRVDSMTLAEVQRLDAAYEFVPGCGTCADKPARAYTYRGVATGKVKPPKGYVAADFRIPTLREVLAAFPRDLVNIEIKRTAPETTPYEQQIADLLAEFKRTDDVIVVSFSDVAIEKFKLVSPATPTALALGEAGAFKLSSLGPLPGSPHPRYVALQVPVEFEGVEVVTEEFVDDAHARGLAVHVWTINDEKTMRWLIDIGVDGIMTDVPTLLERILKEKKVRWTPRR
ncbi:MAG TPA: glycerophosphodiester phosphodiesterase [Mycobacteriales bacterium]|nr:glycerophosphodiester phosphodiesterase [Mycobacteriales bacterium]